jgi:hypothetical protein
MRGWNRSDGGAVADTVKVGATAPMCSASQTRSCRRGIIKSGDRAVIQDLLLQTLCTGRTARQRYVGDAGTAKIDRATKI